MGHRQRRRHISANDGEPDSSRGVYSAADQEQNCAGNCVLKGIICIIFCKNVNFIAIKFAEFGFKPFLMTMYRVQCILYI